MDALPDWVPQKPKYRAVICDIDETICTDFDHPIEEACRVLVQMDRSIEVHHVTARPEASRKGTETFLDEHRLPGRKNLWFCPNWRSSRTHKVDVMTKLAKQYSVLVSIGDADEDEFASREAGVPFVRMEWENRVRIWTEIETMLRGQPEA